MQCSYRPATPTATVQEQEQEQLATPPRWACHAMPLPLAIAMAPRRLNAACSDRSIDQSTVWTLLARGSCRVCTNRAYHIPPDTAAAAARFARVIVSCVCQHGDQTAFFFLLSCQLWNVSSFLDPWSQLGGTLSNCCNEMIPFIFTVVWLLLIAPCKILYVIFTFPSKLDFSWLWPLSL